MSNIIGKSELKRLGHTKDDSSGSNDSSLRSRLRSNTSSSGSSTASFLKVPKQMADGARAEGSTEDSLQSTGSLSSPESVLGSSLNATSIRGRGSSQSEILTQRSMLLEARRSDVHESSVPGGSLSPRSQFPRLSESRRSEVSSLPELSPSTIVAMAPSFRISTDLLEEEIKTLRSENERLVCENEASKLELKNAVFHFNKLEEEVKNKLQDTEKYSRELEEQICNIFTSSGQIESMVRTTNSSTAEFRKKLDSVVSGLEKKSGEFLEFTSKNNEKLVKKIQVLEAEKKALGNRGKDASEAKIDDFKEIMLIAFFTAVSISSFLFFSLFFFSSSASTCTAKPLPCNNTGWTNQTFNFTCPARNHTCPPINISARQCVCPSRDHRKSKDGGSNLDINPTVKSSVTQSWHDLHAAKMIAKDNKEFIEESRALTQEIMANVLNIITVTHQDTKEFMRESLLLSQNIQASVFNTMSVLQQDAHTTRSVMLQEARSSRWNGYLAFGLLCVCLVLAGGLWFMHQFYQGEMEKISKERDAAVSEAAGLRDRCDQAERSDTESSSQIEKMQESIREKQERIAELENRYEEKEEELEQAKTEIAELNFVNQRQRRLTMTSLPGNPTMEKELQECKDALQIAEEQVRSVSFEKDKNHQSYLEEIERRDLAHQNERQRILKLVAAADIKTISMEEDHARQIKKIQAEHQKRSEDLGRESKQAIDKVREEAASQIKALQINKEENENLIEELRNKIIAMETERSESERAIDERLRNVQTPIERPQLEVKETNTSPPPSPTEEQIPPPDTQIVETYMAGSRDNTQGTPMNRSEFERWKLEHAKKQEQHQSSPTGAAFTPARGKAAAVTEQVRQQTQELREVRSKMAVDYYSKQVSEETFQGDFGRQDTGQSSKDQRRPTTRAESFETSSERHAESFTRRLRWGGT